MLGPGESDDFQNHQDQDDHKNEAKSATGGIAPTAAMAPGRQGSDQQEHQDNEKNGSDHGLKRLVGFVERGPVVGSCLFFLPTRNVPAVSPLAGGGGIV